MVGEIDHFKKEAHGQGDWYRDNTLITEPGYDTTLMGNEAVRIIEAQPANTPLFLYLAFTAPHTPYQAPEEYLARYPEISDPSRKAYAAMISAMDDQIGRVVAALEAKKLRGDTLIVFHSDNGGTRSAKFTGESVVKGELPPNNGPYRDGKGTLYEGGTLVGAVANWPGHIKPGHVAGMIHVVDILPTLTGLAGVKPGKGKPLDGLDVWETISADAPSPRSEIVYNVDPFAAAVRQGDWKLVWTGLLPGKTELFNLANDPYEAKDLSQDNPDRIKPLRGRLTELLSQMEAPLLLPDVFRVVLSSPPSTPLEIIEQAQ